MGAVGAAAYALYKQLYAEDISPVDEELSASASGAAQSVLLDPRGPDAATELVGAWRGACQSGIFNLSRHIAASAVSCAWITTQALLMAGPRRLQDAEAHLQHHFDSIQEIADSTTLPSLLPALSRALLQAADVETPLQRLRCGCGPGGTLARRTLCTCCSQGAQWLLQGVLLSAACWPQGRQAGHCAAGPGRQAGCMGGADGGGLQPCAGRRLAAAPAGLVCAGAAQHLGQAFIPGVRSAGQVGLQEGLASDPRAWPDTGQHALLVLAPQAAA
jgi:hypothetical protein